MALTLDQARDTFCLDSLKPARWATGVQLVAQRCYHRLITPPRTLAIISDSEDDADFGLDLAGKIGSTDPRDIESMLPVMVKNELLKDAAVESVKCTATRTEAAGQVRWDLVIEVKSGAGPFDLVVAVDDVTVELLGVR